MIQDIFPHVYKNEFENTLPEKDGKLCIVKNGELLIKNIDGAFSIPTCNDFDCNVYQDKAFFLFRVDGVPYFLLNPLEDSFKHNLPNNYVFVNRKFFRHASPKFESFAAITALQLSGFYESNKFCGKCRNFTVKSSKERMLECPHCKMQIYPRISPAVIIGICNGNKLLLTKYKNGPTANFALVAGFTEIGETLESTVKREVMEEVGLKVKNIRYYKSQPWSFTDTLLAGFYCDVDGNSKINLEENELQFGGWFDRNALLPIENNDLSLTNEMINYFRDNPDKF